MQFLIDVITNKPSAFFLGLLAFVVAFIGLLTAYYKYKAAKVSFDDKSKSDIAEIESDVTSVEGKNRNTLDRVLARKVLRVGCIAAKPWFEFIDGKAEPVGIYPMLLNDIAERNGLNIIYTPVRNNVIFEKLDNEDVDLVAQLLQTVERCKRADFSAYLHNVAMVAVVEKGQTKINAFGDLKSSAVNCAVVKGEIGSEISQSLYKMTEANERLIILNTNDVPSVFYQLRKGSTVDVAITTYARWIEFQKRDPVAAEKLEPLCNKPLLLIQAGSLIKLGEKEFSEWLESETAISRTKGHIVENEDLMLSAFDGAIERI